MTWTNAFDAGECTVSVYDNVSSLPVYQAVMQKGGSQSFVLNGANATVSVSADGAVSLDAPSLPDTVGVFVTPAVTGMPALRARQITAAGVFATARGTMDGDGIVYLAGAGSAWTPDPCETGGASGSVGITTSPGGAG